MRYGSVCSGIEAASVAWRPLGWQCAFVSEIDAFPCAVLAHHHPDAPNLGDMTCFKEWPDAAIDVLVGGTPCQSFSVAGLRKGLADPRGNLMLTYLAIADRYRPEWLVWENVPGVLSSNKGRDFGTLLGGLEQLGYGFAYRVLDAQFFGVAQRRRRVFVVGCLGGWRRAAAVLFERASLRGDPAPRRESGQRPAPTISARTQGGGGLGTDFDLDGGLIPERARALTTSNQRIDAETETLLPVELFTLAIRGRGDSHELEYRQDGTANALLTPNGGRAGIGVGAVAFAQNQRDEVREVRVAGAIGSIRRGDAKNETILAIPINADALRGEGRALTPSADAEGRVRLRDPGLGIGRDGDPAGTLAAAGPGAIAFHNRQDHDVSGDVTHPLGAKDNGMGMGMGMQVRRLTPRECERLQGFPDDYTLIDYRGKPAADGPRYKALGNSMAVPVMRWIGERIAMVEAIPAGLALEVA